MAHRTTERTSKQNAVRLGCNNMLTEIVDLGSKGQASPFEQTRFMPEGS